MNENLQLITAPLIPAGAVIISPRAIERKEAALAASALIGKVSNAAQNETLARARAALKAVHRDFEKARVAMKEPALEYGRAVDRAVAPHKDELDREDGRLAELQSEFALEERRRVQEEERLQQAELARIEREKQAELDRLAREQAEREAEARRKQEAIEAEARRVREAAEAKAREEREAAEKLAREATNKKQRAEAEKAAKEAAERAAAAKVEADKAESAARAERERQEAAMAQERAKLKEQAEAIESLAGQASYFESRPVLPTKARGQSEKEDWEIEVTNPYDLAKYAPDCVTITPLIGKIKAALNEGRELKGVKAKKFLNVNQRAARTTTIDV